MRRSKEARNDPKKGGSSYKYIDGPLVEPPEKVARGPFVSRILQEFRRGGYWRGRGRYRHPSISIEDATTEESTSIDDSKGMGHKKQGVEIRWLEIVQADYTFSFVLKYGGSQRENNVSLITRFGSTRTTPAPRSVSRPLRFAPSSIPVWVERVDPSIPIPNSGSTAETGIKMMFAWKPKALPTLSSEVRRITLPFIRPRFHNICSLNFQERQLHDFFSTFLFSLSFFLYFFSSSRLF